jgi:hypothetical protein
MLRAFLVDENFSIPQENASVNDLAALRANGFGQLPEYFLAIFFDWGLEHDDLLIFMLPVG